MRGGGVRHPERAQRNIRLVFLFGAGGLGDTPDQKMSLANPPSLWGFGDSIFQIKERRQATEMRAGEHLQPAPKCSRRYHPYLLPR